MAKLCLGTVQFGMNYGVQGNGQPDLSKAIEILNTAYDAGIRTYDTATAYGSAEDVLHQFISQKSIDRHDIRMISKTKTTGKNMLTDVQSSLERIGCATLDGCLLHDAKLVFDNDAVSQLKLLKENGLSKEIGVSVYTPEEAIKALEYDYLNIVQVPYNVLDKRLDNVHFFEKAHEAGVSVYVRSVLLQGLLMMNPSKLPLHMQFARPYLQAYHDACDKRGLGYFEAAVGSVLNKEYVDYLVFGVDNLSQLNDYRNIITLINPGESKWLFDEWIQDVPDRVVMPNLWGV